MNPTELSVREEADIISMGYGQKKFYASEAVPPTSVGVPSQRPLAPSVTYVG
jgi:hypothetical protein